MTTDLEAHIKAVFEPLISGTGLDGRWHGVLLCDGLDKGCVRQVTKALEALNAGWADKRIEATPVHDWIALTCGKSDVAALTFTGFPPMLEIAPKTPVAEVENIRDLLLLYI